jgi:hypothetical protein
MGDVYCWLHHRFYYAHYYWRIITLSLYFELLHWMSIVTARSRTLEVNAVESLLIFKRNKFSISTYYIKN